MSDDTFHEVCGEDELPVGRCRATDVSGRKIAIYHLDDGWYATDNACPHRGGPLAEGDVIGGEIVCPWHLWSFDLKSGINPGSPEGKPIRVCTHEVRVENGSVMVRLSDEQPEIA